MAGKTTPNARATRSPAIATGAPWPNDVRVRMYRVGFGDFFLLSFGSERDALHVLIDCGVTSGHTGKGDIGTLKSAVRDMAAATGGKLALIIVTHRHADHIIGFSRCEDVFVDSKKGTPRIEVEAIWMSHWETEYPKIKALQDRLQAAAFNLHTAALAGADDEVNEAIRAIAENATGVERKGGGSNAASLDVLKNKLKVTPQYYARGDQPKLPASLLEAGLSARILGPPPADEFDFIKMMDLQKHTGQYLDDEGRPVPRKLKPFAPEFVASAATYPPGAFREWAPRQEGTPPQASLRHASLLEKAVQAATPNMLLQAAKTLDGFLNNQSLVVLFEWKGKKLLFPGDAQAGNWLSWLYGLKKPTNDPRGLSLLASSSAILGSLDFYKVGHHGSANATPISVVEALGTGLVSFCSTQADTFGKVENEGEVPRAPLLGALAKKGTVVRSDDFAAQPDKGPSIGARPGAAKGVTSLLKGKVVPGPLYVDYFP